MARPELGSKHTCPECETKFYDLNKESAVCPACGHVIAREHDAAEEKEIPVVPPANGLKPPETGDDFNDDEAGVIDDDKDIADLSDDETAVEVDDVAEVVEVAEVVVVVDDEV